MANNPSENIWDKDFTKTGKIEPCMANLIAAFFQYSVKIIKSFVLSSLPGIGH